MHLADSSVEQELTSVTARIYRYDPSHDAAPRYETYQVPYFTKWMRVLDVLDYVAEDMGEDLAYRWFCGVKKCGSCGVQVNGRAVLACWEPATAEMTIEPLAHAPVIRDLVVERTPYETNLLKMKPWLERHAPYPGFPEPLTHTQMKDTASAIDCVQCLACTSACPVLDVPGTRFAGPTLLVQLAQYALDPRDGMDRGRIAHEEAGVWNCVSCYACEDVCPAHIPIVSRMIEPLKAQAYKSAGPQACKHASAFMNLVEERGRIDPAALILRTQGMRALGGVGRAFRLAARGKIRPGKTLAGKPLPKIEHVRRLFQATRGEAKP